MEPRFWTLFYSPSSLRPPISPPSPGAASLGSSWPLSLISRPNPPHPVPPLSILVVSSSPSLLVFMDMDNSWEPFRHAHFFSFLTFYIFTPFFLQSIVSVLGREEGYTAKYGLNPREFPRAQPEGTLEELILRMSLSGRAILHRILPRDYILLYAPCRGSVS